MASKNPSTALLGGPFDKRESVSNPNQDLQAQSTPHTHVATAARELRSSCEKPH